MTLPLPPAGGPSRWDLQPPQVEGGTWGWWGGGGGTGAREGSCGRLSGLTSGPPEPRPAPPRPRSEVAELGLCPVSRIAGVGGGRCRPPLGPRGRTGPQRSRGGAGGGPPGPGRRCPPRPGPREDSLTPGRLLGDGSLGPRGRRRRHRDEVRLLRPRALGPPGGRSRAHVLPLGRREPAARLGRRPREGRCHLVARGYEAGAALTVEGPPCLPDWTDPSPQAGGWDRGGPDTPRSAPLPRTCFENSGASDLPASRLFCFL